MVDGHMIYDDKSLDTAKMVLQIGLDDPRGQGGRDDALVTVPACQFTGEDNHAEFALGIEAKSCSS